MELANDNILVNCISPGFVETDLTKEVLGPKGMADMAKRIPMGRLAQPEEIAGLGPFLCSAENTYLTGQQIIIDGGFTSLYNRANKPKPAVEKNALEHNRIESHMGPYEVKFGNLMQKLKNEVSDLDVILIDKKVASLYAKTLGLPPSRMIEIEAKESNKSLDKIPDLIENILLVGFSRKGRIISIGGGDNTGYLMLYCLHAFQRS